MSAAKAAPDRETVQTYVTAVRNAAKRHCIAENGIYSGKNGALRLGREFGYGLGDFGQVGYDEIQSTYPALCVISYDLKPPVDASEWIAAVREGFHEYERYLAERKEKFAYAGKHGGNEERNDDPEHLQNGS